LGNGALRADDVKIDLPVSSEKVHCLEDDWVRTAKARDPVGSSTYDCTCAPLSAPKNKSNRPVEDFSLRRQIGTMFTPFARPGFIAGRAARLACQSARMRRSTRPRRRHGREVEGVLIIDPFR
jgi:hypothetical protein